MIMHDDHKSTIDDGDDLIASYATSQDMIGGSAVYQHGRVRAAERFLADHRDLATWLHRPLQDRLVDVDAASMIWPFITFVAISRRFRLDGEFLLAKNFGHSMGRWVLGLYPTETRLLLSAAERIGPSPARARALITEGLGFVIAFSGSHPAQLTDVDLDACLDVIKANSVGTPAMQRRRVAAIFGLRKLLFEAGLADCPPVQRRLGGPQTRQGRLAVIAAPAIRYTLLAYLDARVAVLRPSTISKLTSALAMFGEFLRDHHPEVSTINELERRHIESFLTWSATRRCRDNRGDRPVGPFVTAHAAISVRAFLDDITAWGWPEAPARQLMFSSDIAKQPTYLPRALAPDIDAALMAAVADLPDLFARVALIILRGTGLRMGELLDLELDAIVDYGPAGTWLRVPLGKLNTERVVPLDETTLTAFDDWFAHRQHQRAHPHQRHGRAADFVFVDNGRRLTAGRVRSGLAAATRNAGLTGPDGKPIKIVAHQLRHTYATSLVNAGMTMQALMQLLGHTSPR